VKGFSRCGDFAGVVFLPARRWRLTKVSLSFIVGEGVVSADAFCFSPIDTACAVPLPARRWRLTKVSLSFIVGEGVESADAF
jgi:hypothetical protein